MIMTAPPGYDDASFHGLGKTRRWIGPHPLSSYRAPPRAAEPSPFLANFRRPLLPSAPPAPRPYDPMPLVPDRGSLRRTACQSLPDVRLGNPKLSGNTGWCDTSLEGSHSVELCQGQRRADFLNWWFAGG